MRELYQYCDQIRLHVEGRIAVEDAQRQDQTAREILRRLEDQPGVILADEVGMGKTFVALAAAVSVALCNRGHRPVVVMVPPSLKEKWPRDFELFREKCLPQNLARRLRWGKAERAVEFLKLLDDPPERKKSLIFVTHGALSRNLMDRWVMLAIMQSSLHRRWGADEIRRTLSRFVGRLLRVGRLDRHGADFWYSILSAHPSKWLSVCHEWGVDPEGDDNPDTDDDPVPEAVWKILPQINTDTIYDALQAVPKRESKYLDSRLKAARRVVMAESRHIWKECLQQLRLRLPLLILDEAHHLKNAQTKLASLFQVPEASEDADEVTRGPLGGVFERMLFLTATPFQLGHGELCSVLERFTGICWRGKNVPSGALDGYTAQLTNLRSVLDEAQETAVALDATWGKLRPEDLVADGRVYESVDEWWQTVPSAEQTSAPAQHVHRAFGRAERAMRVAEQQLRPWIIRHLKSRNLPGPDETVRRIRLPGSSILHASPEDGNGGIEVSGPALLPFLLAARASVAAPTSRPVFAEGLASSFEAFLHTRRIAKNIDGRAEVAVLDVDDEQVQDSVSSSDAQQWYLDQLELLVPRDGARTAVAHPKLAATIQRVVDVWRSGEKVVVFCHYIATGRVLRQRISEAVHDDICRLASKALGCSRDQATDELERLGERFFDQDSPVRRACDAEIASLLKAFPVLRAQQDTLVDVVRRNVRTPSFLARFFPLGSSLSPEKAMIEAMDKPDHSGLTLRNLLNHFFQFLVERCGRDERQRYIDAVSRIQTGKHGGQEVSAAFAEDEVEQGREMLLPNVRLVNGSTRQETRQRLMLAFNTPFYPEILVASSVLAEGVDLHLNCRYTIHHDLCWNPSTLEQRTGRIDRIGAKAELSQQPIHVYLPYVAETQDEKMYRVVMDRERWFNVVMGEEFKLDARTTEKLASRVPFPECAARELAFKLGI